MLTTILSRIRRNHGLEHATIHILSEKYKNFSAQGNSDHRGFHLNIYGDISEDAVMDAVETAFTRMKNGEHQLAVHPNCGTVLLTTATMTTLAAQAVFSIEQYRQERNKVTGSVMMNALPSAILAAVLALIVSRPIGVQLQARYTTEGDLGEMEIESITRIPPSPITQFFKLLLTGGSGGLEAKAYKITTIN